MRHRGLSLILIIALLFFMVACGGGGGDSSPTVTPSTIRTFHLSDDGTYDPGYSISFSITGNSSAGDNFEGKISLATRNIELIDGNPAIPQEVLIELRNITTGAFTSDIGTSYLDETTHEPIKMILQSSGREYTPVDISERPDIAEIGDFGTSTSWVSDDGRTLTGTWSLEDAGNNLAYLIQTQTAKLNGGAIEYVTEQIITIDETGDPLKWSMEEWIPDSDITINLYGSRTN